MDDFASFTPKKKGDDEWIREANEVLASCRGKPDSEILKAIYARAVEGKRSGTLTNEQIDMFYEKFSPTLDGMRRRKLKKLVEELKRMS